MDATSAASPRRLNIGTRAAKPQLHCGRMQLNAISIEPCPSVHSMSDLCAWSIDAPARREASQCRGHDTFETPPLLSEPPQASDQLRAMDTGRSATVDGLQRRRVHTVEWHGVQFRDHTPSP